MAGYIGTQAVSVNTTSATISDDLAVGDDLTVTDDATIGGTALVTGVLTTTAKAVSNGGIGMPDDAKLTFGGTGTGDLQIFHDGSNSYITDAGTGDLIIRGSNNIRLQSNSGETYLIGELDGPVYLRHNDVNKLATSATGVTVTGEMAATTMDLSSNAVIDGTALVTGVLTTTAATVSNGGGQFNGAINVGVDDTGYDVKFFGATASAFMQWDASTDDLLLGGASRLGIGTASPSSPLEVSNGTENQRIDFASGVVYLMARNASAYITQEYIADIHKFTGYGNNSGSEAMRIASNGNVGIGTTSPWADLTVASSTAFNNGNNYIAAAIQPAISPGESAGMLFGHYPASGYAKQGIFWERYAGSSGSGGCGNLHFINRNATDTSVPTLADKKMTITSTGIVTTPYQPAFRAVNASGQTNLINAYVPWNVVSGTYNSFDIGGNFRTSSSGTNAYSFTCPVAGRYYFVTTTIMSTINNNGVWYIRKNNAAVVEQHTTQTSAGWTAHTITAVINCAANDYINIFVGGQTLSVYGQGWGHFSGYLIG